jgi:predicted amidohydrolase YtcJ
MTDLVLTNGTIYTMDPGHPVAHSIACTEGVVESLDELPAARRTIDLGQKTVVPGLVDAHAHLLACGKRLRELDLRGLGSFEELLARVVLRARDTPPGRWIVGSGYDVAEPPSHERLSRETPDHPVWLVRKDTHSGMANARAMALADLSQVPPGGAVDRERGLFFENATSLIGRLVPEEAPSAAFLAAQREAMQLGITAVHDASVDEDYLRILRSLEDGRSLRLRVHALFWHPDPQRQIDFMRSTRPRSGRLSVRAIKLFMDGSLGSRTAWMLDPPGGMPILGSEDVVRIGQVALETGYQVCTHAIGDGANRATLDAYERLGVPPEARWRIEHAQHVDPQDLERLGRWIASIQPSHAVADREKVEERLTPRQIEGTYAWSKLGRLALGSDAPVESLDPRWTFYCATTRDGWRTKECLSPEHALRGMTADAAYAGFSEGGVLSKGRPADMAVLSADWLKIRPQEVPDTEILATLMDGRVAYQAKGFSG